ncbi:FeoC-like transcriptional regulator [Rickettsiella massiliensis]|uniref:FeoC-like transcriptional regulator n=1 Tax=Rickettsiella massiliensis TaxID=676517 RepID=UPI000A07BBEB|nr:FeoC-like transcriptional regulator [Rickettsiella massiliensis]
MVSLLAIKNFIAEKKTVTLAALSTAFAGSPTEILAILEFYVKKCCNTPACATRCSTCSLEAFTHYQWLSIAINYRVVGQAVVYFVSPMSIAVANTTILPYPLRRGDVLSMYCLYACAIMSRSFI